MRWKKNGKAEWMARSLRRENRWSRGVGSEEMREKEMRWEKKNGEMGRKEGGPKRRNK